MAILRLSLAAHGMRVHQEIAARTDRASPSAQCGGRPSANEKMADDPARLKALVER